MANAADTLFSGPGELPALCRAFDWSDTPLGPVDSWPATLRVASQLVLASGIPHIVLWGRELIQIYNDAYAELIQRKHPAALGRGNLEIWPEVAHINAPIYDRVFGGETVTREDALYPLERNGSVEDVYLTISYSPIRNADGAVEGVLATMVETTADVTLRAVQAERQRLHRDLEVQRNRLATMFDQAPAFIATLRGPDHEFEMANPAYRALVGNRPVVGRTVREALPEVEDQGFIELLDQVYASGEAFVGSEVPVQLTEEGRTLDLTLNFVYQPLRDGEGQVEGILVHGVDVTDMVHARQKLRAQADRMAEQARAAEEARLAAEQAEAEAARADATKSEFVATVSHELRTPLNAILGYTDLLLAGVPETLPEAVVEHVQRVAASGRHLRALVDEVLTFSRLEAGEESAARERVDLPAVLDQVRALTLPLAEEKGLRFDVRVPDQLPDPLSDPRKIQQILVNLVGNAIKFTDQGGVTVEAEEVGSDLHLRVRDTGPGIDPENLDRIFEPFWQAETGTTRRSGGTGLGLGVARRLARMLDGDIEVESTPGEGSTFTLMLPRRRAPESEA